MSSLSLTHTNTQTDTLKHIYDNNWINKKWDQTWKVTKVQEKHENQHFLIAPGHFDLIWEQKSLILKNTRTIQHYLLMYFYIDYYE